MIKAHASSIPELMSEFKSSEQGLSTKEVEKRLLKYGMNEITESNPVRWYHLLLGQFKNIMVLILLGAMIVSYLAGEKIDAAAIGVIVLIIAVVGFVQEFKAEKAVEALKRMAAPHAIVIRSGKIHKIDARQLVTGDIIILEEGSHIPADARLIEASQLKAIEASLTGESSAISKHTELVKHSKSLGDLQNMVFMGTVISQGHGRAIVTQTGMQTEFGKIAHMVQQEKSGMTPLQKQLDKLSKILAVIIMTVITLMFIISIFMGRDLLEMFMLSISLAVSVIPEGLPAVITLTLAIGVQKMAKENAIVRKLAAAETLGSTSVICTDKTGTLTQNQMTVQKVWVDEDVTQVTGIGYAPKGKIIGEKTDALNQLLKIATLCNNSKLIQNKKKWEILGDPTEGCLLTLARKANIDIEELNKKEVRTDELIFDSDRKRMSTVNDNTLLMKGAPDSVLEVCTHAYFHGKVHKLTTKMRANIMKVNDDWAKEAHRVLSFAYKPVKKDSKISENKMIFVGHVGVIDPPRKEVKAAIEECRKAHIKVVMITGDHALTAQAIGQKIGLYKEGDQVITGAQLEKMSDTDLKKIVERVKIYARVNPHHKVRVLKALQAKGHIVAMTGDGVNDAPALKRADIGIAMGITGTDVSQEASKMILTDDNFATIVKSIEQGRVIYRNVKKFIRYSLSGNFDEVLFISIVFLLGYPIPFLPLQILWVNLLTDALPGLALGMDVPEKGIMKLKPRDPNSSIWKDLLTFSAFAGILSTGASLVLYFSHVNDYSIEHTRTMVLTLTVVYELLLVFVVRFGHSHFFTNFFKNKLLLFGILASLGIQLFALYNPWMQSLLKTTPLSLRDWAWILALVSIPIIIMEIWKQFRVKPTHV
ncbi:MAG: Ca2+-transporting ATPase [Oceanicoccus sp.]|jgi:Ca2+-transporting ATPase